MTSTDASYRSAATPEGLAPYVSSGRTPILGLVGGLAAGFAAALFLSILYAYGTIYIPIVQIEFLLTVLFGAAVGAASSSVMHRFKVRSRVVVVGAALLLGVFAWAFSWLPWLYGTFQRFDADVSLPDVFNPFFVIGAILQVYENGTWSIGSSSSTAVSGPLLGIVWVAEALTIVGFSTGVGVAQSKDRVFCEKCESWCTVVPDRALFDLTAGEGLRAALTKGDLTAIQSAARPAATDRWLSLKIAFCPDCGETNVLALDSVKQTVDRKGNVQRSASVYLPFHHVSRGDMADLKQGLGR